ncbi:hypothetical protein AF335_07740 [Streptomyces eurocidicus]|uniref:Uncharacterized protein n=1 Tax=Streptomyces eurocidicus TaxID=66423 RepID=A0A2N8P0C2_STREU|nr:hypothetical protein [Streptomyces eurocidicus]MBB5121716.1 hypothetical protein [Streptomyces eurocidicus]MBF6052937.1 hypothetical protein [Streptomyces eurocidicus]PNE34468.1 hypothetical protein AF335_07740 [Streptomyces eurocidicus]
MRRLRTAGLALLGATLVASVAASPAQASPGETRTVCADSMTPDGWVDVNWGTSASCRVMSGSNIKMIKQLDGLPVGTQVNACASAQPPKGWTKVQTYYSGGCVVFVNSSFTPNAWLLQKTS